MDPLTIAAAIAATKTLVKSAKGVQDIVHGLDNVFHAQDEHEKNKTNKPGSSIGEKNKSILQKLFSEPTDTKPLFSDCKDVNNSFFNA